MSSDAIVAIAIFGITQTGALVFFAGVVVTMLRSHHERIGATEKTTAVVVEDVAQLKGMINMRKGIQL